MPHSSTPIAVVTLSFSVGVLLCELDFQSSYLYLILSLTVLAIGHFKTWRNLFLLATMGCFLVLGMLRYTPPTNRLPSMPSLHEITVSKSLNTNSFGSQYLIKTNTNELILLQTSLDNTFTIGDRFLVHGSLTPIPKQKNPIGFNFKTYMHRKGVSRKLNLSSNKFVPLLPKRSLKRWAHNVQQKLIQQLKKTALSADSKALVMALVLGNKNDLSEERIVQYQRAGAMHLLAISGLHIGIVLLLLRFLVAPLKRIKYGIVLAAVIPLILLWCFALVTGGSPSVVRAVTMFSFLQLGLIMKRKNASVQGVWVSCIVLLFVQPRLLFDVGFQLSYSAVFGIVWMMPHWQRLFAKKNRFIRYTTSLMGLGCIAQLSVLPLSLFYFHQFPLLFWVSNLMLVPFIGLIILAGIGCLIISFFPALYWIFPNIDAVFKGYQWAVEWIAKWEDFFIEGIPFGAIDALLLGSTVIAFYIFLQRPNKQKTIALGMVSIGFHGHYYLQVNQPPKAWITHTYKNSLIITTQEKNIIALSKNKTPKIVGIAEAFKQYYRLDSISYKSLSHAYNDLLIVDSLGVYTELPTNKTVLLRESPKIHLVDLIDSIQPKLIVADGSNYPSYIKKWKETCVEKNIPFHATAIAGAYPLN